MINSQNLSKTSLDVIIDLDSQGPDEGLNNHIIQYRKIDELKGHVKTHLKLSKKFNETVGRAGHGWVLFVDGTRGAGKSTFLQSVEKQLSADVDIKNDLSFVKTIDPSRIEQSEIILLVILQALKKKVSDAIKNDRNLDNEYSKKEWRDAFKRVAGGLSLFGEKHHPLNDLDADLFLDWGLEKAGDSVNLRDNLHKLFNVACKLLDSRAIMFAFDDAETDATHAVNLLECIRKYLDTPQVMILVAGDMELYSLLVRQHFAQNITQGKVDSHAASLLFGNGRSNQYVKMIDHLEEQYLVKLFPIRLRLQLLPLWTLIQKSKKEDGGFYINSSTWVGGKRLIVEVLDQVIRQSLRVSKVKDVKIYREFILRQPLRSLIQLFASLSRYFDDATNKAEVIWSDDLSEAFASSLQSLFITSLYKQDVDTDAISSRELSALCEAVFRLSVADGDRDTAFYLRPTSASTELNQCFVALSAQTPLILRKSPGLLIRYMFSGPGSVALYDLTRKRGSADRLSNLYMDDFEKYLGVGRKGNSVDWARHAAAIIAAPYQASDSVRMIRLGVIEFQRWKKKGADKYGREVIKRAMAHPTYFPVIAFCLVDVSGPTLRTYASILSTLGVTGQLLELDDLSDIAPTLKNVYPTLSISPPAWETGFEPSRLSQTSSLHRDEEHLLGPNFENLVKSISDWRHRTNKLHHKIAPSAILIGKIWTRIFFSLEKAADELRSSANAAQIMEIFALCIINAFMVEEYEHHLQSNVDVEFTEILIDRSNPTKSAENFIEKWGRSNISYSTLPLTSIIASCPIILGLLDGQKSYETVLSKMLPPRSNVRIQELLCPENIWLDLKRISLSPAISVPLDPNSPDSDLTTNG